MAGRKIKKNRLPILFWINKTTIIEKDYAFICNISSEALRFLWHHHDFFFHGFLWHHHDFFFMNV